MLHFAASESSFLSFVSRTMPPPDAGFRLELTKLGRALLGVYVALWALMLVVETLLPASWGLSTVSMPVGPSGFEVPTPFGLSEVLVLHPPTAGAPGGPGFRLWQLVTAPFFHPPGGLSTLVLGILGFVFFAAPVERMLGRRGFLALWGVASAGAVLLACLFGPLVHPTGVHFGFGPAVLAVMLVHCLMTPDAIVPFFLVLQVKMKWIAIGIAALIVVRTLSLNSPLGGGPVAGGYELGGLLAGWLWWRYRDDLDLRKIRRRRKARKLLKVAVDEALGPDHDEPIFH